eukprot:gene4670-8242_t
MKRSSSIENSVIKKKSKTSNEIPTYILFNISCFLPYSDIKRFERVSKSWNSKITSSLFDRFRHSEFNYKTIIPSIYNQEIHDQNIFLQHNTPQFELENVIYENENIILHCDTIETYCHRITFFKNNKKILIQNFMQYKIIGDRLYVICIYKEKIGERFTPFTTDEGCYSGLFCILLKNNLKWIQMENFGFVHPPFNRQYTHDDFFYGVFNCFISVNYSNQTTYPHLIIIFGSIIGVYNLNTLKKLKIKRIPIDSFSVKQLSVLNSNIILLQNYRDPNECPACGSIHLSYITIYNLNIDLILNKKIENGTSKKLIFSPLNNFIFCITTNNILKCFLVTNGNLIWEKKELECTNIAVLNENLIALCVHELLDIKSGKSIKQ